ncbi:hypothetical protein BDV97DRAFT_403110 [Delphinella strobiligena]|nr:hypothetical protein BDV97DRAFT_403110 [Delphinella strobiligena]
MAPTTNDTLSPEPTGSDERFGEVAPEGMSFCPILAVAKFPYKYISKRFSEAVSDKFFNKGQFWNREWDLYWVWSPYCDPGKPYVFIPLDQFKQLVKEINQRFPGWQITIPDGAEAIGLVVNFEEHPECRPRWLGRAASKDDYDLLEGKATFFDTPPHDPPEKTLEAFKDKIEAAINATRQKNSKAAKEAKQEQRLVRQQDMSRAFKRAQRYLGLRSNTTAEDGLSRVHSPEARPINVTDNAPFPFDGDVIFIAVDAEAWERNHNIVTEIGFATLDTRDLHNIPPGKNGENWRNKIRARHFRIQEFMHLVNHEFVQGCADRFDFGTSEFISQQDSPRVVADCFKPPYSASDSDQITNSDIAECRNIVFLGHDTQQDVQYLQKIGYDINNLSNLLEFQDTASMYRVFSQEPNPRNLGHVLYVCEVEAWNMHNAGNDAVYTMQAMLGLCIKDPVENRGEAEHSREKKEAEEGVREEAKERALNDSDDGGILLDMAGLKISDRDASGQSSSPKAYEWEM